MGLCKLNFLLVKIGNHCSRLTFILTYGQNAVIKSLAHNPRLFTVFHIVKKDKKLSTDGKVHSVFHTLQQYWLNCKPTFCPHLVDQLARNQNVVLLLFLHKGIQTSGPIYIKLFKHINLNGTVTQQRIRQLLL